MTSLALRLDVGREAPASSLRHGSSRTAPATTCYASQLTSMKATINIDDALYRRLKMEAARRGRTVRDLVTQGITHVLETPPARAANRVQVPAEAWQPEWFASLARYGRAVDDHAIEAVRAARVRHTRRQSV